jgi:hypothetical protein
VESATARLYRQPSIPAGLPDDLDQLLWAMTASDPAVRPSAAEVATWLARRPAAALVADAGGSTAPRWGRRNRHHRPGGTGRGPGVPLAAAAMLVLAVVIGAYALLVGPAGPTSARVPVPVSAVDAPAATFRQ